MIFNSLDFFIFLPIVYLVYLLLNHRGQNIWLLLASYVFYGWWDPRFLYLIAISTAVDFFCGKLIYDKRLAKKDFQHGIIYLAVSACLFLGLAGDPGPILGLGALSVVVIATLAAFSLKLENVDDALRRKVALAVSMCTNLALLGTFKYFNFFVESAESMLMSFGMSQQSLVHLDIVLPVGISFYTFQTMSYSIDIYRGKLKPCNRLLDFALFVAYFPQLVAGPIERASNLLPKIIQPRAVSWDKVYTGVGLICYGMFKKVVIADGVSASVLSIYGSTGTVSWIDILAATFLFAIQIYCDFSGYSDIARGVSRLLGIDLMRNFKLPYFSRDPSEFWQRWHISLSSWLRDYLYISLGGNRGGTLMTYRNLLLTMLLGGLWHGAAWNFVLWGAYQGGLLVFYRAFSEKLSSFWPYRALPGNARFIVSLAIFFVLTCYGWLLFRAESFQQIADFTYLIFADFGNLSLSMHIPPLAALAGLPILLGYELVSYMRERNIFFADAFPENSLRVLVARSFLYGFMLFIFLGALSTPPTEFIYFQF